MKKHSSGAGAGAMLTKTESSGAGAISLFLQELRSPASNAANFALKARAHSEANSIHSVLHIFSFTV